MQGRGIWKREGCAFCSGERETPRRKAVASQRERGVRFFSGERETPRRKAVVSGRVEGCVLVKVAASVRLHGARPWHLAEF